MSDRIFFQPSDLHAAATRFNSQASELVRRLQIVRSEIERLNSTWQGQAASRFDQLMSEYTNDSRGIDEILNEVSQHLTQAAQSYLDTDVGIARGFSLEADRPKSERKLPSRNEESNSNSTRIAKSTSSLTIRIMETPFLTARNFSSIISSLTELQTKFWLIANGRFDDLIEYTQTHANYFDEETGFVIIKLTHNSPAEIKFSLSLEGVANALATTINTIKQAGERKREVELRNKSLEEEIEKNKRELEAALADKEQARQLEKQKALLELFDMQIALKKKQLDLVNYVFDLAPKLADMLYPSADATTKAMAAKTLIKNFLELDTSKGLELGLPKPEDEEDKN